MKTAALISSFALVLMCSFNREAHAAACHDLGVCGMSWDYQELLLYNTISKELGREFDEVGQDRLTYPYELSEYTSDENGWCSEFVSWVNKIARRQFDGEGSISWMLTSADDIRDWYRDSDQGEYVSRGTSRWNSFSPNTGDYVYMDVGTDGHSGIVMGIGQCQKYINENLTIVYEDVLFIADGNSTGGGAHAPIVRSTCFYNWRSETRIDGIGLHP